MGPNHNFDLERAVSELLLARDHIDDEQAREYLDRGIDVLIQSAPPDTRDTAETDLGKSAPVEPDRLQRLLYATEELADAGGWEWSAETGDVYWTPGTYQLFGVSQDTTIGFDTVFSHIHPDDQPLLEQAIEQCLETGQEYEFQLRVLPENGSERWTYVYGETIEENGDRVGLRGAIRDISLMKEREQRLHVLNRILRHNIRNDLNIILGRAEMLSEELTGLDMPEALKHMDDLGEFIEELGRLAQDADSLHEEIEIMQDGLAFLEEFSLDDMQSCANVIVRKSNDVVRLGEKARHFDSIVEELEHRLPEPTPVRPILESVRATAESRFTMASVQITCPDDFQVLGLHSPLERAIFELVENAIVHTERDDVEVQITVTDSDDWIEIRVIDDGPGIPPMEREAVNRGTETPLFHGQGVGLWLVTWIIRRLGGTIDFHDRDPDGSIVRLRVPPTTH